MSTLLMEIDACVQIKDSENFLLQTEKMPEISGANIFIQPRVACIASRLFAQSASHHPIQPTQTTKKCLRRQHPEAVKLQDLPTPRSPNETRDLPPVPADQFLLVLKAQLQGIADTRVTVGVPAVVEARALSVALRYVTLLYCATSTDFPRLLSKGSPRT